MGSVVLDAGVLVGLLDPVDPNHGRASAAVRQVRRGRDELLLPSVVVAEVMTGAHLLGPGAVQTVEAFVASIVDAVCAVDEEVAHLAASYRARHLFLRLPDALVLAIGRARGADTVLTLDRRWAEVDGRVRVIGP
jgi:predicted nucleic acid-binding protein